VLALVRTRSERLTLSLPGGRRLFGLLSELRTGGVGIAAPATIALALTFAVLGRLGDTAIIWQVAQAAGYPVPFSVALLLIGSAGLAGGISLSPGGLGAAEATVVGLLVARGTPFGAALSVALGTRVLIFWLWVVLGLLVFAASQGRRVVARSVAWVRSRGRRARPVGADLAGEATNRES
jgi:uncharacterized membrane protein YbhN (UPF0104 family)